MASIVSSAIAFDNVQADGRRVVREVWIDDKGNEFSVDYMADQGDDINAIMAARAGEVIAEATALQLIQAANGVL